MSREIGRILGLADSQPLEFWIAVPVDDFVQLDDVVVVHRRLSNNKIVSIYGVVDSLIARHEGAKLETDVFLSEKGVLPLGLTVKAHISVSRVEPEIFVPPLPGDPVFLAQGADRDQALFFDAMKKRFPLGLSRDRQVVYGDFEFLDGSRGAHVNISGISGVATKTTYATFLLYGVFHSKDLLGAEKANTHAMVFNLKGEDLLFLDEANNSIKAEAREQYAQLGLPVAPFESVGLFAPVRRDQQKLIAETGARSQGITPYCWTIEEFCRDRLLRFLFTEADQETSRLSALVSRIESRLAGNVDVSACESFDDLVKLIDANLEDWGHIEATGTRSGFLRRLEAASRRVGQLIRGKVADPDRHKINWKQKQMTVIDIHNLHDTAKRFVIGVMLRRMLEDKEAAGSTKPLVFIVLDELNKYAPREGWSPIKDVILDIAERGRSLGVILIGAEQTASQIEGRVVANSSFRVVGRLDTAEAQHAQYGFLPNATRARAGILKPGSVIVSQPEIPMPLLVQFPFPAWATRPSEALKAEAADPFAKF